MKKLLITILGILINSVTVTAQQNIADSLDHQSYQRKYIVHLPPTYSNSVATPVVIVLHGGSGNYQSVQGFTQMNFVSNQNNFLAVYPQGQGSAPPGFSWADGRNTTADQAGIDDVGFINKLIDTLQTSFNVDTNKIYICGFSNGGFMVQRLACQTPEKFTAFGGLGCSIDTSLIQTCNPSKPVPMAYFSGTGDPEVPYSGGSMTNPVVTPIVPVDTAVQFWVNHNNCQTAVPVVFVPDTVQSDSSTVEFYKYTNCDCNADFYFYKIINGGHTWPGVPISMFPQLGNTNEDVYASYALWDFFNQFALFNTVNSIDNHLMENKLLVYPNPTYDILYIETNGMPTKVSIYNLMGKKLLEKKSAKINLETIPKGIYVLKVELKGNESTILKVIKK